MGSHRVGHDWSDLAAAAGVGGLEGKWRMTAMGLRFFGEEPIKKFPNWLWWSLCNSVSILRPLDCTLISWWIVNYSSIKILQDFPGGSDGKESTCNAGDLGLTPGLGRSTGGGHGNPLQYSCLENPYGQRSLVGCMQSMGSQRVGHDWVTKPSKTDLLLIASVYI